MNDAAQSHESKSTYAVEGLTCGHCAAAVTEELMALGPVTDVEVDVIAGSTSTLTVVSRDVLEDAQVSQALAAAGNYRLLHAL